jgi:hypothetical protein
MTDADLVRLASATYNPSSVEWDRWWDGSDPDGICAGIKDNVIAFRGSVSKLDWLRDLEAVPSQLKIHPQFGGIHAGFDDGMDEFFEKASKFLGDGAYFCGHSLGASHAWLAAGRYVLQGRTPRHIAVFGSPKPGGLQFGNFLAHCPKSSYRNGLDPVTEVPLWIGEELALAPWEPTPLKIEPSDWSEGLMAWHSIFLYQQGVEQLKT